ncbi:P4Hc domain-containing protein [Favolaschia claudopus]|uniref:P4Hc domain-containing protein n=1 Tax=Favolaschia claudopus TaxID=2862362 RepID=A0AAW0D293_9AGAR
MSTTRRTEINESFHPMPSNTVVPPGRVDFPALGLPRYKDCYAIVVDNLYSRETLSAILAEAEQQEWQIAQINSGAEAYTIPDYRNGERIIHDSFPLSEMIFKELRPHLSEIEEIEELTWSPSGKVMQKWRMVRLNERLRFLKYPKGGFFKPHEDGCYFDEKTGQRTFQTLQLYLPSDSSGSEESFNPAMGGATRFWRDYRDGDAYADVEALPGRALVFQHDGLLHSGETVLEGVKCAMRSDILYEKVGDPVPVGRTDRK